MDPDVALPSVEKDLASDPVPNEHLHATGNKPPIPDRRKRYSMTSALAIPLPPSSPAKSPHKTPRQPRNISPQTFRSSPPIKTSTPSPLNSDRQSATPRLPSGKSGAHLDPSEAMSPFPHPPSKRISSNLVPLPSSAGVQQTPGMHIEESVGNPIVTRNTVARDYFRKELALHESTDLPCKTVVIVHDACYGHRYSRPRTSKSALSTIVERPERIHACVLGLSTAYVRMGERHATGRHPPKLDEDPRAASNPPFKIRKTSRSVPLNSAVVTQVHGQKWMEQLQIMCDSAEGKLTLNGKELVRPIGYGKDENGDPLPTLHEGDLYLCSESLNALEGCLGGVCDGVDTVFGSDSARRAFVCIRPPGHHCSSNYPSGFCWLNNVHVGIMHAAMNHGLTHAAIIDFDLHHGDGSQTIAWDHNKNTLRLPKNAPHYKKTPIGYFSLHDINSYPCEMGDEEKVRNASLCIENAHGQSIWNVHLEPWKNQADFWKLYESRYSTLLEETRIFLRHHTTKLASAATGPKPKAAIFLSAGFDASEWEGEGMQRHKVNVPTDFYARFTADVVKLAEEEGLGTDGRVISVLEGGYSDRALTSGVLSHICGLAHVAGGPTNEKEIPGGDQLSQRMDSLQVNGNSAPQHSSQWHDRLSFDAEWWSPHHLESLEMKVNPLWAQSPLKKSKEKGPGNYSSPTQSWNAKMTDYARERRSISEQMELDSLPELEPVQSMLEVDWTIASLELSRLIIPTDRETHSCKHEDLNAEATRARRERQSAIGLPATIDQRMQLRDRKTKSPVVEESFANLPSRSGRRKTIGAVGDLPDTALAQPEDRQTPNAPDGLHRRRSSGASSIASAMKSMGLEEQPETGISSQIANPDGARKSRASSVMPEKHPKALAVKKSRVSTTKEQPVKGRTSPKRATATAPPVPRVPSGFLNKTQGSYSASNGVFAEEKPPVQEGGQTVNDGGNIDDLDTLASGMKKMSIKLKVPSPEENAAREKKAAEERQKKARVPRKPAVPKAPKAPKVPKMVPAKVASGVAHTPPLLESNSLPTEMTDARPFDGRNEAASGVSDLVPTSATLQNAATREIAELVKETGPQIHAASDSGIPLAQAPMQESVRAPSSVPMENIDNINEPHTEPLISPVLQRDPGSIPITSTSTSVSAPPSVIRTKSGLPIFTSSTPIRFGAPSKPESQHRGITETQGLGNGMGETNTTPRPESSIIADVYQPALSPLKLSFTTAPTPQGSSPQAKKNTFSKIGLPPTAAAGPSSASKTAAVDMSIWEVPETPRH